MNKQPLSGKKKQCYKRTKVAPDQVFQPWLLGFCKMTLKVKKHLTKFCSLGLLGLFLRPFTNREKNSRSKCNQKSNQIQNNTMRTLIVEKTINIQ